ncbi:MAG: hypothetical protein R2854_06650 [Caldilineaceae bacterium]
MPVAGWDLMADLALIGPGETDVPPVNLVDGGTINIGEDVYLIGYPGEVDEFPQPTITNGILRACGRGRPSTIRSIRSMRPPSAGRAAASWSPTAVTS